MRKKDQQKIQKFKKKLRIDSNISAAFSFKINFRGIINIKPSKNHFFFVFHIFLKSLYIYNSESYKKPHENIQI